MTQPVYSLRNLRREYSGQRVLDIDTLDIEPGRVYALVGPNGCGKTTLLRTLSLLDPPTAGTMEFMGHKVDFSEDNLALRRQVALVMQDPLLLSTTVYKNVAYGLKSRGVPRRIIGERVVDSLRAVGLEHLQRRRAGKLSGGETQRVALARAVALETPVLLLDEPVANVDRSFAPVILDLVRSICEQRGATVIFTTHDAEQARRLADETVLLVSGRRAGSHHENTYRGRLVREDAGQWFVPEGGRPYGPDGAPPRFAVATDREEALYASLSPEDIILARMPLVSSARNVMRGRIVRLVDDPPFVRVGLDVGVELLIQLTRASWKELDLGLGDTAYAVFKASSIRFG